MAKKSPSPNGGGLKILLFAVLPFSEGNLG